ncbi:MAG: class IV adenylate cyclase [Acidobacteria bacterium]|nr:class IV adenylate cyclase [Acidobacteriota bacterium]MCB9398089.1 class IV adenylate cyclase [Acidobacteriota bacterium]
MIETEVKIRIDQLESLTTLLNDLPLEVPRHFEENQLFDRSEELKSNGQALRIRTAGDMHILTFKGPVIPADDGIKRRTEWECCVSDAQTLRQILAGMGYSPVFRYQKYRTIYRFDAHTQIMLDETPIGNFIEVEGPAESIHKALVYLHLDRAPRVLLSYPKLFRQEFGPNRDMIFEGT